MISFLRRHLSYANVVATMALIFAMGGSAIAARHYLINSTAQINPHVVKALRGHNGARGLPGPAGTPGRDGAPGPATGPAGGDLAGSYPNPSVRTGAITPAKTGGYPGARVELGPATVSLGSSVSLPAVHVEYDIGGVVESTSPARFKVPVTGVYMITGDLEWPNAAGIWRQLEVFDATISSRLSTELLPMSGTDYAYNNVSTIARLNAGETIELKASQSSLPSLEPSGGTFAIAWVGSGG